MINKIYFTYSPLQKCLHNNDLHFEQLNFEVNQVYKFFQKKRLIRFFSQIEMGNKGKLRWETEVEKRKRRKFKRTIYLDLE